MEIPDFTQTWYDDNAGALGTFAILETYFDSLTRQVLGRGYHPEPTKSALIVRPENIEVGKVFRARHRFRMCTGALYLGGYIGDIYPRFSDCVVILLPHQCTLSQPIALEFVVPNLTPKVKCARAHPKSATCPEPISRLKIIRAYNQFSIGRQGDIPVQGPCV